MLVNLDLASTHLVGFIAGGSTVVIVSRKDNSALAEQLTAAGPGKCVAMQADLADDAGVDKFADAFGAKFDRLDVLVNNSGTNWSESVDTYSMKGWDKVYALNVKSVFHVTQKMLPFLEKAAEISNAHSSVINISSIDSLQVTLLPTFAYSSGKKEQAKELSILMCCPVCVGKAAVSHMVSLS